MSSFKEGKRNEGRTRMTYEKEEQGDENEFVHFEEGEEVGGDADDIVEETDEELVITERPGVSKSPQPSPVARKSAAKKSPPKRVKKAAAKKKAAPKKKSKPAPKKKAAKKKPGKKGGKKR
jgi:hypothetical protein